MKKYRKNIELSKEEQNKILKRYVNKFGVYTGFHSYRHGIQEKTDLVVYELVQLYTYKFLNFLVFISFTVESITFIIAIMEKDESLNVLDMHKMRFSKNMEEVDNRLNSFVDTFVQLYRMK